MPKGTKPHRDKRSNAGADAWAKRKKETNGSAIANQWFQKEWRKDSLLARVSAGTLTEKNEIEMERLGMGKPTPLESGRSERT